MTPCVRLCFFESYDDTSVVAISFRRALKSSHDYARVCFFESYDDGAGVAVSVRRALKSSHDFPSHDYDDCTRNDALAESSFMCRREPDGHVPTGGQILSSTCSMLPSHAIEMSRARLIANSGRTASPSITR